MNNIYKLIAVLFLCIISLFGKSQNYDAKSTIPDSKNDKIRQEEKVSHFKKSGVTKVIIVYNTHFDIGYSASVQQVVHDYRTTMSDRLLDAIDKNSNQPKDKQFVWTISSWPMKQILWDGQLPDRKKKIEKAIRDGNIAIHAFPFSMHTESSDIEDMVRGLNISSTISRKFKLPLPISAKMEDVPGYSWFIPTLLTNAGIKFYHMGGPQVNIEYGLPPLFWWEGPDGSRLLTLYNNGYGTTPLPPAGWPYKTWIYINMTGDNQGPPEPETIVKDLQFYKKIGIQARVGTLDDFAKNIFKEDLSKLPVVRSDMGDVWIHGTMSKPLATKLAQNVRPLIGGLDQLSTLEKIWGIYLPDRYNIISEAYEQSLLYSEHTWGLANQHYLKLPYGKAWYDLWQRGLPSQYKLMENSWKDKSDYIQNVQRLVFNPYNDVVATLADNVNVGENRIVVYNPLPWKRDGEIDIDTRLTFGNDFTSLKPVDGGPAVAVSHEYPAIEDKAPMSRFVVKDIPAMGYRTYVASNQKVAVPKMYVDKNSGVIESPFFKATIDAKHGRISSLIDKRTGRELVDANAPQGFGQYFYERFGYKQLSEWIEKSLYPQYQAHRFAFVAYDMPQNVAYSCAAASDMDLSIEKTAIDVKAIMTGTIQGVGRPQIITISLILSAFTPTADLEVSWQKQPDTWPEAAWICLPFKCDNPSFRLGRIGADVDPLKDMVVSNSNYHLFWVNSGVAVYNGTTGEGVGICSPDAPLVSLGEPGEYKFDKRYVPSKPYIYLNLYNNHWRTNFPAWIGNGQRMSARVRIWAFDKFSVESSLYTPGMETRVPLQAACSQEKNGKLPVTQQGISISRKGIAVTAFGQNPDGNGTILRFWEQGGITGNLEVVLPRNSKFNIAQPVNLRGETKGEPVKIKNSRFSFNIHAYAPATFLLKE